MDSTPVSAPVNKTPCLQQGVFYGARLAGSRRQGDLIGGQH